MTDGLNREGFAGLPYDRQSRAGDPASRDSQATGPGEAADPFGGHEFHYESHTDLFRCVRCHRYEVTVRAGDGPGEFEPCAGEPPAGAGPIEVNAW